MYFFLKFRIILNRKYFGAVMKPSYSFKYMLCNFENLYDDCLLTNLFIKQLIGIYLKCLQSVFCCFCFHFIFKGTEFFKFFPIIPVTSLRENWMYSVCTVWGYYWTLLSANPRCHWIWQVQGYAEKNKTELYIFTTLISNFYCVRQILFSSDSFCLSLSHTHL